MRMRCVPSGSFPVKSAVMVRGPPAGKPMSSITRIHFPVGIERFDVRRDGLDSGLGRGIHAGRGVIFDLSMQQQPERPAAIGFAEIEFETVHFGEACKLGQAEIAEVAMRQQIREHVVAVLIVRRCGRARVPAGDHFEWRIRRIAGEVFVGINVEVRRMIDRDELHLIEIHGFFERLHEAEAEFAVFLANRMCDQS